MRRDAKEQRLDDLECDFRPRLIAVLRECASGRWGLFGQNNYGELARYYVWPEADDPLSIKFLEYCSMRGTNLKGEPRLAQQFLAEIRKA